MMSAPKYPVMRPYSEADAADTLAIFIDAVTVTAAAHYSVEQVLAWARPEKRDLAEWHVSMAGRESFVALVAGRVAGFSDLGERGHIDMLFVHPGFQRRGVGRALLGEAERRARHAHETKLTADVSVSARPLFEACGFAVARELHPVRHGVRFLNYRMCKTLKA